MGDDRHGRAPRPGGRAPWEHHSTGENTERDGARTSRRSRHADAAADSGSAPLTVQDLVEKVDNERTGRRRRADNAGGHPSRRAETAPEHPARAAAPAHPAEPPRRAPESPAPHQRRAPEAPHRGTHQAPQHKAPAGPQRGVPEGTQRGALEGPQRGAVDGTQRGGAPQHKAPEGPQRGAPEGPQRGAAKAPQRKAPEGTQRGTPRAPRAVEGAQRGAPDASLRNATQAPARRAPEAAPTRSAPGASPDEKRRAAATPARQATQRRAPSAVVDDITGATPAAPPRRVAEPAEPEEVTDVLPPLDEPEKPETATTKWPTTESAAAPAAKSASKIAAPPKAVGSPPLSRLAASKQRRNRRMKTAGRAAATLVAVLVLLITGGGWSYVRSTTNNFTQVSALDENSEDIVDSNAQLGDENYLLVGSDTRAGVNGQLGAGTLDDAEGSRADTTMLVHIPKARNRVVVVSFPRDLDVTRPQCKGWDNEKEAYTSETFPSAMGDKLNAVYNLGGPKCLLTTIQRLTGASINHFIGIDFAGFETMVDTIDGVEVCATKPLVDDVLGTILEKPGKQRIDGETALNYVRARHVYGEERSDYDRINRQQRFLASLLRGALSSKVLFDPGRLKDFIDAFSKHTWVDAVEPNDLLMLGRSLQKVDAGAVTFITVPTAGTTAYGNEIPRESDIKAIFKAIRDDQPLPGEKPTVHDDAPASTSAAPEPPKYVAVDPGTVSLLVSNGSGYDGLARTAATKLDNQGFSIYNVTNYVNGTSATTKVRYGAGLEAAAATVATAIPGATIEATEDLGGIVEVVIGADSANGVTVKAPTPVGDQITNVVTSASTDSTPAELPSDLEHVNAADEICK
ncbi:LCP family protein [Nocardia sp. NPDC004654]|uniref:LCP family glycopolymer transferase n=1 Tax=Nocardia sp. NPDC004654 TaxID=3154776 RepID=UPI0033A6E0E5